VEKTVTVTATAATTEYADNGDGTVTHNKTGLTWKRCAEGLTWSGSTCSGTAQSYTWDQAMALSSNGWSLPTEEQLLTIVDTGHGSPTINQTVFPSTPASYFWSASANANFFHLASGVYFDDGHVAANFKSFANYVRLVRGGQSVGASSLIDAERIFNWAESAYAQYFVPAKPAIQEIQGYTYRYYSGSRNYLAVKDGKLWLLGPVSQDKVLNLGPLTDWLGKAKAAGF